MIRTTHTRTYNEIRYSNPYLICRTCGGWVTGYLDTLDGLLVTPCEHTEGHVDVCPSWGPVDGCTCIEAFGVVEHGRPPGGDDRG